MADHDKKADDPGGADAKGPDAKGPPVPAHKDKPDPMAPHEPFEIGTQRRPSDDIEGQQPMQVAERRAFTEEEVRDGPGGWKDKPLAVEEPCAR